MCYQCYEIKTGRTLHKFRRSLAYKKARNVYHVPLKKKTIKSCKECGCNLNDDGTCKNCQVNQKIYKRLKKYIEKEPKCPVCNSDMVLRTGKYGKFYGCSKFPYCKGTKKY